MRQATEYWIVEGRTLMTDLHILGPMQIKKFVHKYKKVKAKSYIYELEVAVIRDREVHEKKD